MVRKRGTPSEEGAEQGSQDRHGMVSKPGFSLNCPRDLGQVSHSQASVVLSPGRRN